MTNKNKLLVLSLATMALGLASCGGNSNPGSGSTDAYDTSDSGATTSSDISSDTSSGPDLPTAWTEAEESLMKEFLNGHVLPFLPLANLVVGEDDYGGIEISGTNEQLGLIDFVNAYKTAGYKTNADDKFSPTQFTAQLDEEDYSYLYVYGYEDEGLFSLSATFYQTVADWPEGTIAELAEVTGVEEIPAFPADAYICYVTTDMFGITYYTAVECLGPTVGDDPITTYNGILTDLGWTLDDTYFADYGEMEATLGLVALSYVFDDGVFYIYASAEEDPTEGALTDFPTDEAEAWLAAMGVTGAEIPAYEADCYYTSSSTDTEDLYGAYFEVWSPAEDATEAKGLFDAYLAELTENRETPWTVQEKSVDEATLIDPTSQLLFDLYYGADDDGDYFCVDVYTYEDPYADMHEESFSQAVAGESSVLAFEDVSDLVSFEEDWTEATWNNFAFSLKIGQGTASQTVGQDGNTDYLAPVLRVYTGQVFTIYAELPIASIEFDWAAKSGGVQHSEPSVGSFEGNVLTLPEGTTTVSFSAGKQLRVTSITVTFAEAAA